MDRLSVAPSHKGLLFAGVGVAGIGFTVTVTPTQAVVLQVPTAFTK